MGQFFTRNPGWKLLSLAIAVALWLAVAREPEVATSLWVPVEFKNPPSDLDISGIPPDRVRLEVQGPSGRLTRDNLSTLAVLLDLSDAEAGERTYNIRARNINFPSGVNFDRAVPSQLTLRFERVILKDAAVQPAFVNKPAGYRVVGAQINPAKVRIRGSEDRLRAITQIRTDPMDLTDVVAEHVFHPHLNVGDGQVRLDTPTEITVRVKMEKIMDGGAR